MTELELQLRASALLETVKKQQRDLASMRVAIEDFIPDLLAEIEMWRDRYEAERQAHIVDLQHFEREQTP